MSQRDQVDMELFKRRVAALEANSGGGATPAATTIFAASTVSNIHGAGNSTQAMAYTATVNNAIYVDTFVALDTEIVANVASGTDEWMVTCEVGIENSTINNRSTYRLVLTHTDSLDAEIRKYGLETIYIRDDASTYDEGIMHGQRRIFVSNGDKLKITVEVLDTQTGTGTLPAVASLSPITIDRITYT